MPVKVATSVKFTSIAAGEFHTCALSTDGSAYCWGKMKERTSLVPVRVDGMPKLKQVTSEYGMACGLTEPGAAYCWGETEVIGKFVTRAQPALIPGGVVFASIAAGGYHSCGLTTQGAAWCWGFNQVGQIGAAPDPVTQAFALPGGLQFASIAAGGHFTCGLTSAGARCIGGARLPGSDVIPRAFVPIPRESEHPFVALSGGGFHACAIDTKGGAWCWGGNAQNQVTLGDDIEISEPRQVRID
jgi:alpha-tubulin suppressor-like RCC1 family protein